MSAAPPGAPPLDRAAVAALRVLATRFGAGTAAAKARALAAAARRAIVDAPTLLAYHDALLFLLAYPVAPALRDAAARELARVAGTTRGLMQQGPAAARRALEHSGLAWTEWTIDFGFDIARWLVRRFPAHAALHSFAADGVPARSLLAGALLPLEFELAAAGSEDSAAFVAQARGAAATPLRWLVDALLRLPADDALRDRLWEALHPYVTIRPADAALSRTFVRGLRRPTYFHAAGLLRSVDPARLIRQALPRPRRLAAAERLFIVDAGRAMLAALGRETDAIALADPTRVAWYDLPRGASIALYVQQALHRSPLDAHVGFVLFKNGLPVGYGGGWPFLGSCRIGINVFAPYRGGESAYLFCQVLRTYARLFGVDRFVAEPSQYGGSNREGLQSGAFWFYYRLGFRPVDRRPAALAAEAFARIEGDPGHREPLASLRRFTGGDVALQLGGPATAPACEPATLSRAVTAWVDAHHAGNRRRAEAAALSTVARALDLGAAARWSDGERHALRALAPLLALLPGLARWPLRDRRALVALIRAKAGDEVRFHRLLGAHTRLRAALTTLAATGTR